ncbi:MAG: helix-turn-helix domain-containing protein [Paracoccaceae bacterium]
MQKKIEHVIADLMKERGENKMTLARKAGVSRNTVTAIMKGRSARPKNLDRIAKALGLAGREELEARAAGPNPLSETQVRDLTRGAGMVRVTVNLRSSAWLNSQLVLQRFGITPTKLFEAAPVCFALLAELSLSRRRARTATLRDELGKVRGLDHIEDFILGLSTIEAAFDAEDASIARRELDGVTSDEREFATTPPAFGSFLEQIAAEVGLPELECLALRASEAFDFIRLYEDDLDRLTGGDRRATFALERRHTDIERLPVNLRYRSDEGPETVAARREWLAGHVPDAEWLEYSQLWNLLPDLPRDAE